MRTAPLMKGEMIDLSHAPASMPAHVPLIELRDLRVVFPQKGGDIKAVRRVSISIAEQERVAILGESGCGKTMTAMSMLGLQPAEAKVTGRLSFRGRTVDMAASDDAAALVRNNAGAVFQDSLSSLNPTMRIGAQLVERLTLRRWDHKAAFAEAVRILQRVGVPDPQARMAAFPHELSGGMRQRVMISMAILSKPALLVADEPTTALDTTVQAQVIDLIREVQDESQMALILITHDIAMAAETCDRAIVMYAGFVVEDAPIDEILDAPRHPYTRALLKAMPRLDSPRDAMLEAIDGEPPSARRIFSSCPFAPRCFLHAPICDESLPELETLDRTRSVRCHRHREMAEISRTGGHGQ